MSPEQLGRAIAHLRRHGTICMDGADEAWALYHAAKARGMVTTVPRESETLKGRQYLVHWIQRSEEEHVAPRPHRSLAWGDERGHKRWWRA